MIKKQKLFFNRDRNIQAKILKQKRLDKIIALGCKLKSQGLSSRKIHQELKKKGYKIGYSRLFYLIN